MELYRVMFRDTKGRRNVHFVYAKSADHAAHSVRDIRDVEFGELIESKKFVPPEESRVH